MIEKKKKKQSSKSLIRFHNINKINTYNGVGEEKKRKEKKNSKELQKPNVETEFYDNKKCDWR